MAGLVAALHKDFQKSLAAADTDRARMLLRLAAALTAVNVVQPGSFLAALHSLAGSALAAVQPGEAQTGGPTGTGAASRTTAETGQMVEQTSGQSCKSNGAFQCSPAMLFWLQAYQQPACSDMRPARSTRCSPILASPCGERGSAP